MNRSFFCDPDHHHYFGPAFELIESLLSEEVTLRLISVISIAQDYYPDCHEMTLGLSSLYEAIEDYESAYDTLIDDYFFQDSSLCKIRKALLNRMLEDEDEELLSDITRRHDDPQFMRRLYAFLGYTITDDHEEAKELWLSMLEETVDQPPTGADAVLDCSDRYSILTNLSFREQIEGIRYLLKAGITENLEIELVAFADGIPGFLKNLLSLTMLAMAEADEKTIMDPLSVIVAAAYGSVDIIDVFLQEIEETIDAELVDHIYNRREESRQMGEEAGALIHLLQWMADPVTHEDGVYEDADLLMHSASSSVLMIAAWISSRIPSDIRGDLPPEYQMEYFRNRAELIDGTRIFNPLAFPDRMEEAEERTPDEILALSPGEVIQLDDTDLFFSYLRDHIRDGNHLDLSTTFIELGLDLDRMDEVLGLRDAFLEYNRTNTLTLIQVYLLVLDRRYKNANALIDRIDMHADWAALFLARIYLSTDNPKKVIEICEKLVKKKEIRADAYPLLIMAYRAAGSVKKAEKAEAALKRLG